MSSFAKSRKLEQPPPQRPSSAVLVVAALDIVVPYLVFAVLRHSGTGNVAALCWAAAVSGVLTLWGSGAPSTRGRAVGPGAGHGAARAGRGVRHRRRPVVLARDAVITGGLGVVFAGSALTSKPLLFLLLRSLTASDPDRLEGRWASSAPFRSAIKVTTALWGACLLGDALLRLVVVYTLPVATAAAAVTALTVATVLVLLALLRWYLPARMRRS